MVSSSRKWEGFRCRNPENDPVGSNPRSMCSNQLDATLRYVQRKKKVFFCFFSFRSCVSRLFPDPTARAMIRARSANEVRRRFERHAS